MNKLNKNEHGFTAIEILLVVVTLAIIGTAGYFVAKHIDKKNTPTTAVATVSKTTTKTPIKTLTDPAKETTTTPAYTNATTIFKIPELGIQIAIPASLSTLTYNYSAQSDSADVSTSLLSSEASGCTANDNKDSANFDALGLLTRGQGTGQEQPDVTIVKQYSTYYISYTEPQDTCLPSGASTSLVNLWDNELQAFKNSLSTVQPIQ
jgi:Flp pilus assembly pilin Flp